MLAPAKLRCLEHPTWDRGCSERWLVAPSPAHRPAAWNPPSSAWEGYQQGSAAGMASCRPQWPKEHPRKYSRRHRLGEEGQLPALSFPLIGGLDWWRLGMVSHLATGTRGSKPRTTNPNHRLRVARCTGLRERKERKTKVLLLVTPISQGLAASRNGLLERACARVRCKRL